MAGHTTAEALRIWRAWASNPKLQSSTVHSVAIALGHRVIELEKMLAERLEVMRGVLPLIEEVEATKLVGDEGALWPVEAFRAELKP